MRASGCSQSCPAMSIYSHRGCTKWPVIYLAGQQNNFSVSCYISSSRSGFGFDEIINVSKERNRVDAVSLDIGRHFYYLPLDILIARAALDIIRNAHGQSISIQLTGGG